jgi:hypothetical protein
VISGGFYPRADVTEWRLGGSWYIADNVASFELRDLGKEAS